MRKVVLAFAGLGRGADPSAPSQSAPDVPQPRAPGRQRLDAHPPGLDPAPIRKRLPGSVRQVVTTQWGDLQHNAYPAIGTSNLASALERQRMAKELQTQNPNTYADMSLEQIVDLLSAPGKQLHTLSAADDAWAKKARGQVALTPVVHGVEGKNFPAGTYLYVAHLVSNSDAGGLRGGGSQLLNLAKMEAVKSGAMGLKLYTDTDEGARFYLKNGFELIRTEQVDGKTRQHMGWRAPAKGQPES